MCSQLHHIISVSLSEQVEKGTTHTNTHTHTRAQIMKRHLPWPGIAVWNFKADSIIIRTHGFYFRQKKYKERFLVLVHSFIITITPTQLYYQIRAIVPRAAIRIVTECICTLCLCCCLYSGCVALSVFFRVCTSVDLLRMRYVLWFTRHYETSL